MVLKKLALPLVKPGKSVYIICRKLWLLNVRLEGRRMMEERGMHIEARVTPEVFWEFALFDTFRLQKRARAPLLFALILLAFAAICFIQVGKLRGAALLGGVLSGVAVILPLVYIGSYVASVRRTCRQLEEAGCPVAYELRFLPDCVRVRTQGKQKDYPWKKLHAAWRLKHSIALYSAPRQAWLLPNTQDAGHERKLWEFICAELPEESCHDMRKADKPKTSTISVDIM